MAESFFATLKTEALGDRVPVDHVKATRTLGEYIDGYYNTKRRHSFIDYETPIEFELKRQPCHDDVIITLSVRRREVQPADRRRARLLGR